jgi:hypothetical protein
MIWPNEHVDLLRSLWTTHSAAEITKAINERFGAAYSRSAVIGKADRLSLPAKRAKAPKALPRTRVERVTPFVPRPVPVEQPTPVPPPDGGVSLLDLDDGMCKWMISADRYCGGGTGNKRERYCASHKKIGTQPLKPSARPYIKRKY